MVTAMSGGNFGEDELQLERCQEILQLLVAAGYFRARIRGLSIFDKIVGGFVWCIQVCAYDIEVELLFNENWNIGTKIALTEKIVRVLKSMNCPHPIEPHQIQGDDYIHIYPVVQWLVKKALETRDQTAQYNSAFAKYQLEKCYDMNSTKFESLPVYKPVRSFRHNAPESLSKDRLLDAVLLEYSRRADHDDSQHAHILGEMHSVKPSVDSQEMTNTMRVQELVERRRKELDRGVEEWQEVRKDENESTRKSHLLRSEILRREKRLEDIRSKTSATRNEIDGITRKAQGAEDDLATFRDLVKPKGFSSICALLEVLDEMKEQDSKFKKECRNELEHLTELLETEKHKALGEPGTCDVDEVEEKFKQVSEMKKKLAKLNRQIGKLQRSIDQIPSRSELGQFQRRFIELHQQVADVHKETKQYFTMYNTMNDLCAYLEKETALVDSIQDNFDQAMTTSTNRELFFGQVEKSVQGIRQNRLKTERRRHETKMERDKLHHEYLGLVKQQRSYVRMVAEFRNELRRNQLLMASKTQQVILE